MMTCTCRRCSGLGPPEPEYPTALTPQQRDALTVIEEWYPMPVPVWNLRTDRDEIQVNARAAASLVRLGLAEHTRTAAGTKAVREVREQDKRVPATHESPDGS